jgi:hypothetical protein
MSISYAERDRRAAERKRASDAACARGNPKNVAWLERWQLEFAPRWTVINGKYYPRTKP